MKAGFVGTGFYAAKHADELRKINVEITACFGTNKEKTQAFSAKYGAKAFEHPLEMISKKVIDVLYIVVPPFAHDGSVERAAIDNGIPFLCEKPIGLDLNLCRDIAARAEKTGLVTSSGYKFREGKTVLDVKEILGRNRLSIVRSSWMAGFVQVHWWRKMDASGGMMVEQVTHYVDFMRFLLGEIKSVSAVTNSGINFRRYDSYDIFDSMDVQLVFESGLIGSIGLTNTLNNGIFKYDRLDVFGQDFMLSFFDGYGNTVRYKEGANEWVEMKVDGNQHALQTGNFIEAAEKADPSLVRGSYPDACRTLEATFAMNRSAETGKRIRMDEFSCDFASKK